MTKENPTNALYEKLAKKAEKGLREDIQAALRPIRQYMNENGIQYAPTGLNFNNGREAGLTDALKRIEDSIVDWRLRDYTDRYIAEFIRSVDSLKSLDELAAQEEAEKKRADDDGVPY